MKEEINAIRETAGKFAERELRGRLEELDAYAPDALAALTGVLCEIGFFQMCGADGMPPAAVAAFIEEVSRACPALGIALASHAAAAAACAAADPESPVMALCWMEDSIRAGAGLGLREIETKLGKSDGGFVLDGAKISVPGVVPDALLVALAKTAADSFAWVRVPADAEGVTLGPVREMMGLRLCPFRDVKFDGVRVAPESVVTDGLTADKAVDFFMQTDLYLGAVGAGMALEAYGIAAKYSTERYQGGVMICDHDAIRVMLARIALKTEAARAMVYGGVAGWSSVVASEAAVAAALDGVQVLGGYGYMRDYGIERILRDAKTFRSAVALPHAKLMQLAARGIEKLR